MKYDFILNNDKFRKNEIYQFIERNKGLSENTKYHLLSRTFEKFEKFEEIPEKSYQKFVNWKLNNSR